MRKNRLNAGDQVRRHTEVLADVGKTSNPLRRPKVMPEIFLDSLIQSFRETRRANASLAARDITRYPARAVQ
jgi:hypothetical protein